MVHAVLLKSSAGQLLWLYAVVCGAEVVCWAAGVAYAVRLTSSAGQLGLLYSGRINYNALFQNVP